ncbi:Helicase [Venturia nashicola]|uniref:Helicase n=1 Tax=Venturia nashicola TaxID=86259 RepID=A0A4Z1NXE9_9PEZI|nr:Helicase [Venturia nashicola]TLD29971.1 Helicase [Venturia nashicola]
MAPPKPGHLMPDALTKTITLRNSIPQMDPAPHPGNHSLNESMTVPGYDPSWLPVEKNSSYRTYYTIISLFCMIVLALMLGSRAKHLGINNLKSMNLMRFLVIALYILAMGFVASASIFQSIGVHQPAICFVGSYVCLAFYVASKALMYMFLVERAHSIRAPYTSRLHDKVWCFWQLMTGVGFIVLVLSAFMYPHTKLVAGNCEMGLPMIISISLLVFDTLINFTLTAVFIWLIRPLLAFRRTSNPDSQSYFRDKFKTSFSALCARIPVTLGRKSGPYHQEVTRSDVSKIERLVWKTIGGTILIVLPTIANLVSLTVVGGREHAWICYTVCTADITWSVCVIHWLTVDPLEVNDRPTETPALHRKASQPDVDKSVQIL